MSFVGLKRTMVGEIMDSPALDRVEHLRALAGLRRINQVSGTVDGMLRPILGWVRERGIEEIRMLDVACGGGDVPIGVAVALERAGIRVRLTLSDRSEVALEQARRLAEEGGIGAEVLAADAVAALPRGEFDLVTNSLFLHHLERGDVVRVLGNMGAAGRAGGLVVISDLRRSAAGWWLAWAGCRVLSRSKVVHFDGPVSVRAAWTVEELGAMAREAGMGAARVERAWPWRMMVTWQRPRASEHVSAATAEAREGVGT